MPASFQQITLFEAAPQIRQAIRAGNVGAAVNLFLQTGETASTALFEKYSEAQQEYERNNIGINEWGRVQTQICQGILGTIGISETEIQERPSTEIKANMLQLLHANQTAQALEFCESFGDQFLLLQAQLSIARHQSGKGLIESEYYEATKSKINDALFEWMEQVPDDSVPSRTILGKLRRLF
jgi:hypothetical protein